MIRLLFVVCIALLFLQQTQAQPAYLSDSSSSPSSTIETSDEYFPTLTNISNSSVSDSSSSSSVSPGFDYGNIQASNPYEATSGSSHSTSEFGSEFSQTTFDINSPKVFHNSQFRRLMAKHNLTSGTTGSSDAHQMCASVATVLCIALLALLL